MKKKRLKQGIDHQQRNLKKGAEEAFKTNTSQKIFSNKRVILALILASFTGGAIVKGTQTKEPEVSHTTTPEKTPREIHEKILNDLQQKEFLTQKIINIVEKDLLVKLKGINSSNPELQKVVDELIKIIEMNMTWADRNFYTIAIRLLEEKDPDQPFTFTEDDTKKPLTTSEEWCSMVGFSNKWKISPPYFAYKLNENNQEHVGSYTPAEGTLSIYPHTNFQSLLSLAVLIHELVHIYQAQVIYATKSPEEIENYKENMSPPIPASDFKPFLMVDIESDAHAASMEIINAISDGRIEKMTERIDTRLKRINITNESEGKFVEELLFLCDPNIQEGFFRMFKAYFSEKRSYPHGNSCLDFYTFDNPQKKRVVTLAEVLKTKFFIKGN